MVIGDAAFKALQAKVAATVAASADENGLIAAVTRGRDVALGDGRIVPHCTRCRWPVSDAPDAPPGHWVDVEHNEAKVLEMAAAMVERIHSERGPGRVWHLGDGLVHIVNDDGMWLRHDEYADRMLVRLRTYHNHEADAR